MVCVLGWQVIFNTTGAKNNKVLNEKPKEPSRQQILFSKRKLPEEIKLHKRAI
jgi:hypothetical protein